MKNHCAHIQYSLLYSLLLIVISLSMIPGILLAQEKYPDFDQSYWVKQRDGADAKIRRGAGLGVLGLASIAPTTVMLIQAVDDPQKYMAQSMLWGLMSLGAIGHGIGSVGFGRQQRSAAKEFINAYEGSILINEEAERAEYLHNARKTRVKTLIFGAWMFTAGSVLLTNGVAQSVRRHRGAHMGDIRIWPYYLTSSVLLPLGAAIIVLSGRTLNRLKTFESQAATQQTAFLFPLIDRDITGAMTPGMSYLRSF